MFYFSAVLCNNNYEVINLKNKNIKSSAILGTLLFAPLAVNKLIFYLTEKINMFNEAENIYEWRLGKIGYSVKGNGKPLLLIHNAFPGSSSEIWGKNTEELSKSYKVYTLDLLGYGTSERVNTTYTAYTFGKLINDFISDIIQKPTAICAVGEGAMFAAVAYKINPDNFKRFILINPNGISDKIADNSDTKKRKLYELPVIGESIYLYNMTKHRIRDIYNDRLFSSEKSKKYIADNIYVSAHIGGGNNRFVYASYITDFMNMDIKDYLSEITIPTMVIWGEKCKTNPIANMETIKQLIPNGEFAVFEETGELPNYENPTAFNSVVKNFLK